MSASFLQSPVALERAKILKRATEAVAPGGYLLITSHAAPPSGGEYDPEKFPQPASELAALELDPGAWEVITAEIQTREGTHHGNPELITFKDTVILVRRTL